MEVSGKSAITKKHNKQNESLLNRDVKIDLYNCAWGSEISSQNLCIRLSLKCMLIDTWKGNYLMNQFFETLHWTRENNSEDYISFHLIVHLFCSQSGPLIWMGDLSAICKQNLRNTKTEYVQSNSISTRMKTFLSNSKSFRKNEHVIVTPQPSAMFFTLCKILTHHISFFRHQLRF